MQAHIISCIFLTHKGYDRQKNTIFLARAKKKQYLCKLVNVRE